MDIGKYCSELYNLCLNSSKTGNLIDTSLVLEKTNLLFLRNYTDTLSSTIIPNYHLADGMQLFFNYTSNILNINVINFVNYFFYTILIITFGSLLFEIYKSNLRNKILLILISITFYVINIYLYNYSAEYLVYSISSIIPLIFLIKLNSRNDKINLFYLFAYSFLAIIILGTMRYYSYLGLFLISLFLMLSIKKTLINKVLFTISIIGLIIFKVFIFESIEETRKVNIKIANPEYNYEKSVPGNNVYTTFYPGLGFLNNQFVPNGFLDSSSYTSKLLPKNYNQKYGMYAITESHYINIKNEVWKIIINNPFFVVKTIFAKVGILILYLLIICNYFLINFFLNNNIRKIVKYSLLINLSFFSIFPIVSIPSLFYSSGFLGSCFCILLISLGNFDMKIKTSGFRN